MNIYVLHLFLENLQTKIVFKYILIVHLNQKFYRIIYLVMPL